MIDDQNGMMLMRQRIGRRRRIAVGMMAAAIIYALAAPRLPNQGIAVAVLTFCFLAAVAIGGILSWRDRDEVERREAITAFAASGFSLLLVFPLLKLIQPAVQFQDPVTVLGLTCMAIGLGVWGIRRFIG